MKINENQIIFGQLEGIILILFAVLGIVGFFQYVLIEKPLADKNHEIEINKKFCESFGGKLNSSEIKFHTKGNKMTCWFGNVGKMLTCNSETCWNAEIINGWRGELNKK